MYSINPNLNNKYNLMKNQPNFKADTVADSNQQGQTEQNIQIPDIYNVPNDTFEHKSFKETVKEADMMGMVYPWLAHPFLMVGTCAGLAYGVDKFSQACGGDYEKSLLGKASKLGDKIANSDLAQSNAAQTVNKYINKGKQAFNNLTKKSDVINAIRTTPSSPEWGIVKDELLSQDQRIVREFTHITDSLQLSGEHSGGSFFGLFGGSDKVTLNKLALTKEEKELVNKIPNKEEAVNTILLKRLGRSESEIQNILGLGKDATQATKNEILKEMGLTADKLELIKKDTTGKYVNEVKAAAEKVKNKVWVGAGNYSWLGPIQPFERRIGCDEVYNRLHSMSEGASTSTGRAFSKFLQRCHRGFTFGGGKLGVLMFVAPHLVETMIDTKKADPDQKVGTVANGVISAISWVFTFPLGLKIMHSLTGAQYAGMGKDKVEEYRNKLNNFNKLVTSDHFKNKAEYNTARKTLEGELKALKKVEGQNLLTKAFRKLGSFITMDLEQIKSYRNGTFGGNTARKLPSFFKNLGGIPMRLILWGGITMFGLDALITKGTKSIFGNFYDRMKEEEHEANKKKQKQFLKEDLQARLTEAQRKKIEVANAPKTAEQSVIQNEVKTIDETNKEEIKEEQPQVEEQVKTAEKPVVENKTEQELKTDEPKNPQEEIKAVPTEQPVVQNPQSVKEEVRNRYIPNPNPNPEILNQTQKTTKRDNYTYIPSQDNVLKKANQSQTQKYIPSQNAANISKSFDNSGLEGALRRADRAEERALQVLSGNFD